MSLQALSIGEAFKVVWGSWIGRTGVIILGLMVIASIYTLATMPLDYGTRNGITLTIGRTTPKWFLQTGTGFYSIGAPYPTLL